MYHGMGYELNEDDIIIIVHNFGAMIRCYCYMFTFLSELVLINSHKMSYLIISSYFAHGKLRHPEVKCLFHFH